MQQGGGGAGYTRLDYLNDQHSSVSSQFTHQLFDRVKVMAEMKEIPQIDEKQLRRQLQVMTADKLYERRGDIPGGKNYRLLVTRGGIAWLLWKEPAAKTEDRLRQPIFVSWQTIFMSFCEFEINSNLHDTLDMIVGHGCTKRIMEIINSDLDIISKVHQRLALTLITYLDLKSILNLMLVNRHFCRLCNQQSLWKTMYAIHYGLTDPSVESASKAPHADWKDLFQMRYTIELEVLVEQWYKHHHIDKYNYKYDSNVESSLDSSSSSEISSSIISISSGKILDSDYKRPILFRRPPPPPPTHSPPPLPYPLIPLTYRQKQEQAKIFKAAMAPYQTTSCPEMDL